MKYISVLALCFVLIFETSCSGQNKTNTPTAASGVSTARTSFAGEWKLNESKSQIGGFPRCIFGGGDRLRSRTMRIAVHSDFLTVDVASEAVDGALVTRQEKMMFNEKTITGTYVGIPREMTSATWSDDGRTMIVNSVRSFDAHAQTEDFKVTEVWKLINDGKSIVVKVNSKSVSGDDTMLLVYDRQMATDYRF
ncbi:hypothetical protein WBG78_09740 [Chryseolinea sp. T2]|uniref:hypothetical protein n=1 Tax=Chryseolinea sp. T2 TaxID=3129255 RepID=UPI0030768BCF